MIPTFKDLETGETAKSTLDADLTWWSEGNGSCDCNREFAFGRQWSGGNTCLGSKRYIAIDVEGDLEGYSKEEALKLINETYENQA